MEHVLRLTEQFEIVAESERPPVPPRVLKFGDTFSVFNHHGDMLPAFLRPGRARSRPSFCSAAVTRCS